MCFIIAKSNYNNSHKVDLILQYLQSCPDVLGYKYDASAGSDKLEFLYRKNYSEVTRGLDHNNSVTYLNQHREMFLPLAGKIIRYEDSSIGVKGSILITNNIQDYTVVIGSSDKPKEETKSIFLLSIKFNIEDNINKLNIQSFYDKMIERDAR
ncbi:MAG: hypothetical protein JSR17_01620 [Proteobacteria bacterium]|nr:hypothetical protein [Pseudomonadota bacterium]